MKRHYWLPAAALLVAASVTSAQAQDAVVAAPADQPATQAGGFGGKGGDWTGFYLGGQLGYGFGEFDLGEVDDFDTDGIVGGFMAGYRYDFGEWVLGAELQYDWSDLSISGSDASGDFDGIARLKGMVGYDLGASLVYGTAGVAYTNFDGLSGVDDIDFDDPGYVLGFGYDYQINTNWVVGVEYQFHQFDDFGADDNDVSFNTIHARAYYQF